MIRQILWMFFVLIYLSGCTTMTPITSSPDQGGSVLKVGDKAVLTLKSGQSREFAVTRMTTDEVCGESECVKVDDIAIAARTEFSIGKSIGLAVLIIVSVAALGAYGLSRSGVSFYPPAP